MLLRYRSRIYPTGPQSAALARAFGCARVVYDDAVAARKAAHAEGLPFSTTVALSRALITEVTGTPERSWLGEVSAVVLQQALADCDAACKNFFDSVKGKRRAVTRVHEQIKDRRDDWINQQVTRLVADSRGIYIEDLSVKGLARGRAAKSIHDAALGMSASRLESKAARAGRSFVREDRFFPSTQLCSACGVLAGPKGLEGLRIREWRCGCGAVHDRDRNAAVNILHEGQRMVAAGQAETRNASGGQVRPGKPGAARNTPARGQNEEPTRTLTTVS